MSKNTDKKLFDRIVDIEIIAKYNHENYEIEVNQYVLILIKSKVLAHHFYCIFNRFSNEKRTTPWRVVLNSRGLGHLFDFTIIPRPEVFVSKLSELVHDLKHYANIDEPVKLINEKINEEIGEWG